MLLFRAKNDSEKNESNTRESQTLKKPSLRHSLTNNSSVPTCESSLKMVAPRASDTKQVCGGKKSPQLELRQSIKATEDRAEMIRHKLMMATKKREVDSRRKHFTDNINHAPPHREKHPCSDSFNASRLSSLSMNDSSCEGRPRRGSITISDLSSGKGPRTRAGSMIDNEGSLTTDDLYGFLRAASSLDSSSTLESSTASKKSILKEGKYHAGHTSMPSLEHGRSSRRNQTIRKSFHHSLDDKHHWLAQQQRNQQVTFVGATKALSISGNQYSQPTHNLIPHQNDGRVLHQSRTDSDRVRNEIAQFQKSEGVARYPIHGHKSFDDLAIRRAKILVPARQYHKPDGVKPLSNDEIDRYNHQRDRKFDNGPFQLSKKEEEVIMRSMGVRVREAHLQHDDGDNIVNSKPSAFKKLLGFQSLKPEELSHNQARLVAANAAFASVEDRIT